VTVCFSLAQEDAVDWLRGQPDASVDLVITDPAYESLEKHRKVGTTTRLKHSKASSNDWFKIFPNARFPNLLTEMYRVLKPNTHCYIFCDQETGFLLHRLVQDTAFKFKKALIWDKAKIGLGYSYRARHEWIVYLEKGKRALNDKGVPDVLSFPRIHDGYPAQKPVELIEVLVMQSSVEGELVLDPFCGSGSTGVAAVNSGRHFAGTDTCTEALGISRERLQAAGGEELRAQGQTQSPMHGRECQCAECVSVRATIGQVRREVRYNDPVKLNDEQGLVDVPGGVGVGFDLGRKT
jgi:site-specific DNA-methyltransferase (adenine-specific)